MVNKPQRLRALTVHDDYDYVTVDELVQRGGSEGFDPASMTTESDGRVSVVADTDKGGRDVKMYLLKKPQAFYDHDYEEGIRSRQAMMEARVYEGDLQSDADQRDSLDPDITYVARKGANTLGDTAARVGAESRFR